MRRNLHRRRHPLRHLLLGIWYGYPICCIASFIWEFPFNTWSERLRRHIGTKLMEDGRVPCHRCMAIAVYQRYYEWEYENHDHRKW